MEKSRWHHWKPHPYLIVFIDLEGSMYSIKRERYSTVIHRCVPWKLRQQPVGNMCTGASAAQMLEESPPTSCNSPLVLSPCPPPFPIPHLTGLGVGAKREPNTIIPLNGHSGKLPRSLIFCKHTDLCIWQLVQRSTSN